MKVLLVILLIGSLFCIIRALVLSYINIPEGSNLMDLFKRMHWLNYVPIINFLGYTLMLIYNLFHLKIK